MSEENVSYSLSYICNQSWGRIVVVFIAVDCIYSEIVSEVEYLLYLFYCLEKQNSIFILKLSVNVKFC